MTSPGESAGNGDEQLRHIEDIINTLGEEATGGTADFDRVVPDFIELDDESRALLQQSDRDGAPIPYTLQFITTVTGWLGRLTEEGSSPELVNEINAGITIREGRYPDSPIWDRMRGHVAKEMYVAGDTDTALGLIHGMRSKHAMARAVIETTEADTGGDPGVVMESMVRRFAAESDNKNLVEFFQAMYDEILRDDPGARALDSIELMIRLQSPGYEPLQSWATSMASEEPQVNWDDVVTLIENETLWSDRIPLRFRQFAMASHFDRLRAISSGIVNDEYVEQQLADLAGIEEATPGVEIWDHFRYSYGARLLEVGRPEYAAAFGRAIQDASFQQLLTMEMIERGATEQALRLAGEIRDAHVMAETLLDGDWPENEGIRRLEAIIDSDEYLLEQRIACLSMVHERMLEAGSTEAADRYKQRLTEMQQRLSGE
jgi:hypothetical protein